MGIGGSGVAPIAIIAKKMGFEVSGCDMSESSYYSHELVENGVSIKFGHDPAHLEDADILAVTPAVFDINPNHPEIVEAKRKGILMTWQQFSGAYLHKDKYVLSVAGTHGKSTTTVLLGVALEKGGLDPIVEAGTVYKPWGGGYRATDSKYFVCEADEFNNNYLNFHPSVAIINNIEMDHPEFFRDFTDVKESFKKFIQNLKEPKILIVNEESQGIREVLFEMLDWLQKNSVKVVGYYMDNKFDFPFASEYRAEIISFGAEKTKFKVCFKEEEEEIELALQGIHNVQNSLGVLAAAVELGVNIKAVKDAFASFKGVGRRGELVGEVNGIKVYDDYAHHPTAVGVTLESFKNSFPGSRVIAVIEPHQISRLKIFMKEFADSLRKADYIIVTKTFVGREIHKGLEPVDLNILVDKIGSNKAVLIEDSSEVIDRVVSMAKSDDVIVVLGAGNSYKITKGIVEALKK
jgi:UDP-N-acetylmuramate--alanine ligase